MALHPSQLGSIIPFLMSDDIGLLYSPALLFDAGLDASITDHPDFSDACRDGFRDFVWDMYEDGKEGNGVFVSRSYTYPEIEREIVLGVARRYDAGEQFFEQKCGYFPSLSLRTGFMLGWLSALALIDRPLALRGVRLLGLLAPSCQREEARLDDQTQGERVPHARIVVQNGVDGIWSD